VTRTKSVGPYVRFCVDCFRLRDGCRTVLPRFHLVLCKLLSTVQGSLPRCWLSLVCDIDRSTVSRKSSTYLHQGCVLPAVSLPSQSVFNDTKNKLFHYSRISYSGLTSEVDLQSPYGSDSTDSKIFKPVHVLDFLQKNHSYEEEVLGGLSKVVP